MGRGVTTYTYRQISVKGWKAGRCVVCGKGAERSKTFTNTVNPWNRNEDGSVRTAAEVLANVRRLACEWEAEPVKHARCES